MIVTSAKSLAAVNIVCILIAHLTLIQLIAVRRPFQKKKK